MPDYAPSKRYTNEPIHFNSWYQAQLDKGGRMSLEEAKEAWNAALECASEFFDREEGTSYGAEHVLRAL